MALASVVYIQNVKLLKKYFLLFNFIQLSVSVIVKTKGDIYRNMLFNIGTNYCFEQYLILNSKVGRIRHMYMPASKDSPFSLSCQVSKLA